MLSSIRIENFRCLRDVSVRLSPLTMLVGANASGKTTLLRAIAPSGYQGVSDHWRHQPDALPKFLDPVDGFSVGVQDWYTRPYTNQYLHLDLDHLRQSNVVAEERALGASGHNLTNVFATLPRRTQDELARELARLVPVIADVTAKPLGGGQHRLVFQDRWAPAVWYEPHEVSDGTILTTAFLTLQHQDPAPQVIAIEEPERGLHPYLIGQLVDFLRKLAAGEIGSRAVQVVLATHSPQLLEFARPDEVRFLDRDGENIVVKEPPTTSPEWEETMREYEQSLGSVWLSGSLGGFPGP